MDEGGQIATNFLWKVVTDHIDLVGGCVQPLLIATSGSSSGSGLGAHFENAIKMVLNSIPDFSWSLFLRQGIPRRAFYSP